METPRAPAEASDSKRIRAQLVIVAFLRDRKAEATADFTAATGILEEMFEGLVGQTFPLKGYALFELRADETEPSKWKKIPHHSEYELEAGVNVEPDNYVICSIDSDYLGHKFV